MKRRLSDGQQRVLDIILKKNALGESPTHQEIADEIGVTKARAWAIVGALISKGVVRKSRKHRDIWAIDRDDEESLVKEKLGKGGAALRRA